MLFFFSYAFAALVGAALAFSDTGSPLWTIGRSVTTSSGRVEGHSAANAPFVSEYLGIPYAIPPVGDLRWAAPRPFRAFKNSYVNGTSFGYSCPSIGGATFQAVLSYTGNLNLTVPAIQVLDSMIGQSEDIFSEDCLTLNIWTKPQTGERKKAVMLYLHGGAFTTGTSNIRAYNGQHLADTEDIVVVTINYRLNIFGFPGALNARNNLGLLDQRIALEWTRDNIRAFGGDPDRITVVGESAGASSVDFYSFAWTRDPIAAGFIAQSGTANVAVSARTSTELWYSAVSELNCGNVTSNPDVVLSCMRSRDQTTILRVVAALPDFGPAVDNITVFADNFARASAGNFIQKPYLIGINDNEVGFFRILYEAAGYVHSEGWWVLKGQSAFNCGAAQRSKFSAAKVPTWRYRYFGDFPNLSLSPASGAWHGSEVPMIFGTDLEIQNYTARTASQSITASYIRSAWSAFVKDPEAGLTKQVYLSYGWPRYNADTATLVMLAYNDNGTGTSFSLPADYDFLCPWVFPLGRMLLSNSSQSAVDMLAEFTKAMAGEVLGLFAV
ncbi:carboxylesterase [Drepanopeziza brunnea f. sp. 'multigermtubi' MB_m1]|uniref:Carboxylic ester hydrolase n=1 Tax=Marssonina brunnea f. sp. multigermtubi (strain MB_m1) TaxID=1072389 RepID=K1WTX1_MARBU|nr:carboxylesterase [Drepanopeziza brunnea f. sp. 'multigermtubi' MB_m1]EKD21085.1 carboxylesterase [Drepanopeziza brunnea f. sp. 'multigermtubi' MB_m1]